MSSQQSNKMPNTYCITVSNDGEFMFQSDHFTSRSRCKDMLDKCSTMDLSKLTFQFYKCAPKGPQVTNDMMDDLTFMTLEKYKHGYLLRPYDDDERCGKKYFLGGWWMPKFDSWFFKKEQFDMLIEFGAEYISDVHIVEDYASETDTDVSVSGSVEDDVPLSELHDINSQTVKVLDTFDLTGLMVKSYGRGYIVCPPCTHKNYETKYYGPGWWNDQQKGWFFRKDSFDTLMKAGAVIPAPTMTDSHEKVTAYGRGFIMKPKQSHPQYTDKFYKNGWWMDSQKGWFFKREFVDTHSMTLKE